MRFTDGFFPQRIRPYVEGAIPSEPKEQEEERPLTLQEAFQRDPKRQPIEVAANGTLCRTAENIGGLMHLLRDRSPDYESAIALPGLYGRHVRVEGSGAYDHHPHPDETGVMLASIVLRVTPGDHVPESGLSYYILAMTPRHAGTDTNLSPSQAEFNDSVPALIMPEQPDGSLSVFTLSQTPGYYEPFAPADAQAVHDIEAPRYIEAVNFWANST